VEPNMLALEIRSGRSTREEHVMEDELTSRTRRDRKRDLVVTWCEPLS
jgi:hypothetical protein